MLRERQQITCEQLAERLGVGKSIVAKWCKGTRVPSRKNIKLLCDYFKVQPAWLIYGIDSDAPVLKEGTSVSVTLDVDGELAYEALSAENKKAVLAFCKVLYQKQQQEKQDQNGGCVNGD